MFCKYEKKREFENGICLENCSSMIGFWVFETFWRYLIHFLIKSSEKKTEEK